MAAARAIQRSVVGLGRSFTSVHLTRSAVCGLPASGFQSSNHFSTDANDGGGSSQKRLERDDRTWTAFDDPGFLGEDFSTVKPEDVGRARARVTAAQREAFLERLQSDPTAQSNVGEHFAHDPEQWPLGMTAVKAMPHWMLFHYAQSELESDAEASDVESHKSMHRVMINMPQRDAQGRAGAYGGRKNASAYARVKAGKGQFTVNRVPLAYYFSSMEERKVALFPLIALEACGGFDVDVHVQGGGVMGQAGAIRNALARALVKFDPYLKPVMKRHNLLVRDNRMVERKKPGQRKARKKFQWVKR